VDCDVRSPVIFITCELYSHKGSASLVVALLMSQGTYHVLQEYLCHSANVTMALLCV